MARAVFVRLLRILEYFFLASVACVYRVQLHNGPGDSQIPERGAALPTPSRRGYSEPGITVFLQICCQRSEHDQYMGGQTVGSAADPVTPGDIVLHVYPASLLGGRGRWCGE